VALARDAVEAAEQGRSAELASRIEAIGTLTAAGDAIALDLIREGGNRTGQVIVGLVCFFNPGLVVIGGGVTGLGTPCSSRSAPSSTVSGCPSSRATCPPCWGSWGLPPESSARPASSATTSSHPRNQPLRYSSPRMAPRSVVPRTRLPESTLQPARTPAKGIRMAPEAPLLSMSGITKSFPGGRPLDGIDLDVQADEVHCLLGQNGAGKSTLIKRARTFSARDAPCPHRIRGRYRRPLTQVAARTASVAIEAAVRRFTCLTPWCEAVAFVDQIQD
jgi:hypothetical protein